MPNKGLSGVNRTTLREQALSNLRDSIVNGTFEPGTRLAEVDLAEQLGVSRGTVREALRYLQQSGLVEGAERSGLRVRELSAREILELFKVRAALEALAVTLIIESDECDRIADDLERHLPQDDPRLTYAERLDTDLGFHERLCNASGNSILVQNWTRLKDLMRVAVFADRSRANSHLMTMAYHQPIVDAIRSSDASHARKVMHEHMDGAAARWASEAGTQDVDH